MYVCELAAWGPGSEQDGGHPHGGVGKSVPGPGNQPQQVRKASTHRGASRGVSEPKLGEEGIHTEKESAEEGRREDWSSSRSIDYLS